MFILSVLSCLIKRNLNLYELIQLKKAPVTVGKLGSFLNCIKYFGEILRVCLIYELRRVGIKIPYIIIFAIQSEFVTHFLKKV